MAIFLAFREFERISPYMITQLSIQQKDTYKENGFLLIENFFSREEVDQMLENMSTLNYSSGLLGSDIYVHQTKLNTKHAFVGDWWEWHQDYIPCLPKV